MTIISQGRSISAVTAKRKIMKIERRKKKREKFDQRKELREHKKCNRFNRIVFVFSFLLSNYIPFLHFLWLLLWFSQLSHSLITMHFSLNLIIFNGKRVTFGCTCIRFHTSSLAYFLTSSSLKSLENAWSFVPCKSAFLRREKCSAISWW